MNKAELFHLKVLHELSIYSTKKVDKYFLKLFLGDQRDKSYWTEIYRQYPFYPCYYYQYLACVIKVLKAKQVVEIGADRGASTVMMASEGAWVYSVDIRKDAWEYARFHKNVSCLVGDSCDLSLFEGVDLNKTDLWLIDGLHTYEQVKKELEVYQKYFKTGDVIILDDTQQLGNIMNEIYMDKLESVDIHGNGVGVVVI